MRCQNCHYSLANRVGLTEHRCPECGSAFDPKDPATFRLDDSDGMPNWVVLSIVSSGFIVAVTFIAVLGIILIMVVWANIGARG